MNQGLVRVSKDYGPKELSLIDKAGLGVANFLILDDLHTITNPDGSYVAKGLAVASITPFGKAIKAGNAGIKLVRKTPIAKVTSPKKVEKVTGTDKGGKEVSEAKKQVIKDGSHINEKGKIKPNVNYKAGEFDYIYETDNLGRISKFETDNLQLTKREARLPHDPNTPGKVKGDHAGHLAGDRFGGSPELDNLISQSLNVNLSQYKKIENQWAKALDNKKQVKVSVKVKYDGDSSRPSEFNIQYEIDGKYSERDILN
ncbi:DNA/RNA non-specific endonuclease [Sporosarcina sp. E16_8]|nr:DNA/RNA non-specific endonuclease [Sporosarcina sp. E16_8]